LRGAKLPGTHEALPQELIDSLGTMEPLEVLAAEREASRSRSPSPGPSGRASPAMTGAEPRGDLGFDNQFGMAGAFGESSAHGKGGFGDMGSASGGDRFGADGGDGGGFGGDGGDGGSGGDGGFGEDMSSKKKEKSEKDKQDKFDDGFGGSGGDGGFGGDSAGGLGNDGALGSAGGVGSDGLGGFHDVMTAEEDRQFGDVFNVGVRGDGKQYTIDVSQDVHLHLSGLKSQFEAVSSVDRQIAGQLRKEVDDLHKDMRMLQSEIQQETQLQKKMMQEMDQHETHDKRPSLNAQLLETKGRLASLRDERKTLNAVGASLRQDHGHLAKELEYLQKLVEDEEKTVEIMRRSAQHLEKSYRGLETHGEKLQQQCRETTQQLRLEQETKHQDEQAIERLRRELASQPVPAFGGQGQQRQQQQSSQQPQQQHSGALFKDPLASSFPFGVSKGGARSGAQTARALNVNRDGV